jgi:spore maturation protein CgeB
VAAGGLAHFYYCCEPEDICGRRFSWEKTAIRPEGSGYTHSRNAPGRAPEQDILDSMKILYACEQAAGTSSSYRRMALERLGHEVVTLDPHDYIFENQLLQKVALRLGAGPKVEQLNRDLIRLAETARPEIFWADKLLQLQPKTLKKMRAMGITSVSYMIDNAFGPRRDPGWRLYMQDIPFFDLHVTQRSVNFADYLARGARDVMKVQTAYEPTIHFPPPEPVTDAERTREVSFIGTPYDDRAEVLTKVSEEGLPVTISGSARLWAGALSEAAYAKMFRVGELYEKEYREAIWKSKINLSFLTRSNHDEYTHKSFEIAGCGGFLMAERSEGHMLKFKEDEEAVFFSGVEELMAKIRRYLPDEGARARIAAAGRERAVRDGYHNDHQVELIVARAEEIRAGRRAVV